MSRDGREVGEGENQPRTRTRKLKFNKHFFLRPLRGRRATSPFCILFILYDLCGSVGKKSEDEGEDEEYEDDCEQLSINPVPQ